MNLVTPLQPSSLGDLSPELAVERFRQLLLCEARYGRIRPDAITLSCAIYTSDGGIDAEVSHEGNIPPDSFLRPGRMGVQIKTGASFKPWQPHSVERELVSESGALAPEVRRILEVEGHYVLACFGIDFTPQQRNVALANIAAVFAKFGFGNTHQHIDVFGQSQLAAYFDRYPSLRLAMMGVSDDGFLSIAEWSRHAHMANQMVFSNEQQTLIQQIQAGLRNETKHFRLLGEPGIGKSRLVLEAVRADDLAPTAIYVPQGEKFGLSILFRELIRTTPTHPMILIIDELPERELTELWGHLKHRTGTLKLVTIDHGPTHTRDEDTVFLKTPRLHDDSIRAILTSHVGEHADLDRWISICEGSPRVAQAIGANLAANPSDMLRPPATVPFWDRFLHGYSRHDSVTTHQTAVVMQHIALFSRFGFEPPVDGEARYIASLAQQADPSITWARFQELIQSLRERRVIQGTRTLFIVPWALHIYLWREYWKLYARGFDSMEMLDRMPESLQGWFVELFRYAHNSHAAEVVKKILRPDGFFSNRTNLVSRKGAAFLEALTEGDPTNSLILLESTIGNWSREELLEIDDTRQQFVRILEMIAVWRTTTVRAMHLLARLALAENSNYSNNATGTLLGLFHIGPEWAATEASPSEKLPVLRMMLRSNNPELRLLGLKAANASLSLHGGIRIVGAEHQGLKERAKLWRPKDQQEWRLEIERYWDCLITETRNWEDERSEAKGIILSCLGSILRIPELEESALNVLHAISDDPHTDAHQLNYFLADQIDLLKDEDDHRLRWRLQRLAGRLARKTLESRFQRYIVDCTWNEWERLDKNGQLQKYTRSKRLVTALAKRVANDRQSFERLLPFLVSNEYGSQARRPLVQFGKALAVADNEFELLDSLLTYPSDQKSNQCVGGYMTTLKQRTPAKWKEVLLTLLASKATAPQGAELIWHSGFDSDVFDSWVLAYEHGWISVNSFEFLCYGKTWQQISRENLVDFLRKVADRPEKENVHFLIHILNELFDDPILNIEAEFALKVVTALENFAERHLTDRYRWKKVCEKLATKHPDTAIPMLDALLVAMGNDHALSYDHDVEPIAQTLVRINPTESWNLVTKHLLSSAPRWRLDLLHWLKGGIGGFGRSPHKPPIAEFPVDEILAWVDEDPTSRAPMIAHAAPKSLEENLGGDLTRALLKDYGDIEGVSSGISANFHSGGWTGPESQYQRKKREQLRTWLGRNFDQRVCDWIEREISYLDRKIEVCEIQEEREPWNRPRP